MNTCEFLSAVFDRKPGGTWIVVWSLPTKRAASYDDARDAARYVGQLSPRADVYVGAAAYRQPQSGPRRGAAADVAALVALWADVDIAGPGHAGGKAYPPDEEAARALVAQMPRPPSIIVRSGHGLQPWWLLSEPLPTGDAPSQRQAERLVRGWQGELARLARGHGWAIDATADLARVLRVPGTVNNKLPAAPVEVRA